MKDAKALMLAACILREEADSLRQCHTINGEWPEGETNVLREYNLWRRLSKQLERIAEKSLT